MEQTQQQIAEDWAEGMHEIEGLEANLRHATSQLEQKRGLLLNMQRQLLERVGRNIPRKIYGTTFGLVIVEHECGVSLQEIEKGDR